MSVIGVVKLATKATGDSAITASTKGNLARIPYYL
jgi:hypothetical protein